MDDRSDAWPCTGVALRARKGGSRSWPRTSSYRCCLDRTSSPMLKHGAKGPPCPEHFAAVPAAC